MAYAEAIRRGGKDKDNLREHPQELLAEAVLFDDD